MQCALGVARRAWHRWRRRVPHLQAGSRRGRGAGLPCGARATARRQPAHDSSTAPLGAARAVTARPFSPCWAPLRVVFQRSRRPLTLLARAIMAKTALSAMTVVWMPASASRRAMTCPPYRGAPSATTTCVGNRRIHRRNHRIATSAPPRQSPCPVPRGWQSVPRAATSRLSEPLRCPEQRCRWSKRQ